MSQWFFLSYARENNRDRYLDKFCAELNSAIGDLTAPEDGEDGFFDAGSIEVGQDWLKALTAALQNCRAFISFYSPAYFNNEFCGKEWQFFSLRQAAASANLPAGASRPALMFPVLWTPEARLPSPLPDAVSHVQYSHSDFGEVYARVGLRELIQVSTYRDEYVKFLSRFATKLIEATLAQTLPPLQPAPLVNQVESAFHQRLASRKWPTQSANDSPRCVQFVFVAGRRDELVTVREKLDAYGDEGGCDWHPYLPDVPYQAGIIAQGIATEENLLYAAVELDGDIIKRIEDAERQNKIVAILVDTWTLRLPQYQAVMQEYNFRNFVNCAVLVPLNNKDDETKSEWSALFSKVRSTFVNHYVNKNSSCFVVVDSHDELRRELATALHKARARLIEKADVIRKAENAPKLPSITGVRRASA